MIYATFLIDLLKNPIYCISLYKISYRIVSKFFAQYTALEMNSGNKVITVDLFMYWKVIVLKNDDAIYNAALKK